MERQGYNWDWNKVNPLGGGIALGHPIGATAIKLAVTIMGEMERENHRYGLVTMCVGGGQGGAMILENLELTGSDQSSVVSDRKSQAIRPSDY